MLSCSVNGISKPLIFFLGICLKRPTLHVLIHATIDSNGLCTFKTGQAGQLDISTSCQWFCKILKRKPETEKIQVEVLEYSALLSSQNQRMEVHANSCAAKTFTIDLHTPYKPRKPRSKLPFGLTLPKKAQNKSSAAAKQRAQKKKRKGGKRGRPKQNARPKKKFALARDENRLSESTPSESSDSDSTSSRSSAKQKDPLRQQDAEAVEVSLDTISKTASTEERTAQDLVREHEKHVQGLMDSDGLAETNKANPAESSAQKSKPLSSFFAKEIGVDQISIAVTGRSKCFHCKGTIAKDDVRYSYYHSTKRPSVWVHDKCLAPLAKQSGNVAQVGARLTLLEQLCSKKPDGPLTKSIQSNLKQL